MSTNVTFEVCFLYLVQVANVLKIESAREESCLQPDRCAMENEVSSAEEIHRDLPSDIINPHQRQSYTWMQLQDALSEKEFLLECAHDSIKKLSVFVEESKRKDDVIASLRKEVAAYKKNSRKKDYSYVTMEEHLVLCEDHLHDRMDEVITLQKELDETKKQLEVSTAHSLAIRKELSSKVSNNGRHIEEISKLQKLHRSDSATIVSLKLEVAEKRSMVVSLHERVKKLRCSNQEAQKRLEHAQAEKEAMFLSEQKLKVELAKVKNHAASGKLLKAREEFFEQELTRAKRKENELGCEVGRLREQLAYVCKSVAAATNSVSLNEPVSPSMAIQAVSNLAKEQSQSTEAVQTIALQLEEMQQGHSAMCENAQGLQNLWSDFKSASDTNAVNVLITGIQDTDVCEDLKVLKDIMVDGLSKLHSYLDERLSALAKLTEMIKEMYSSLPDHWKEEEDLCTMIALVSDKLHSTLSECEQLNQRLCESELEKGAALTGAVTALRKGEETRTKDLLDKTRQEEMAKCAAQLAELRHRLEEDKQLAVHEAQANTSAIANKLTEMKAALDAQQAERDVLKAKLIDFEAEVVSLETSKGEALSEADTQKAILEQQLVAEVNSYKTNSDQHAVTIVALEKKLLEMMNKIKSLQEVNERLSKKTDVTGSDNDRNETESGENKKMEALFAVLRHQLALASDDGALKDLQIRELEGDLEKAALTIQEKEEKLAQYHLEVHSDLRITLAKQEEALENQRMEIEQIQERLHEKTCQLNEKEEQCRRALEEVVSLKSSLEDRNVLSQLNQVDTDFYQVCRQCLGEKHKDVIKTQKLAISQLRRQLNDAELATPPGTHQATLRELSRVRRELVKVKSERLLAEGSSTGQESKHAHKEEVELLRIHKAQEKAMLETLDFSEKSYKELTQTIHEALPDLEWPAVGTLLSQAEHSDRKRLLLERKKYADSVSLQLRAFTMKNQSQEMNPQTGRDGTYLSTLETIAELQAQLNSTSDELEQQKRLNHALLKRKIFKETQCEESLRRPQHSCVATYQ